jgi:hypothetical protein
MQDKPSVAPVADPSPKDVEAGAARVLQKRARGMQTRREIAKRKEAGELPGQVRPMMRAEPKVYAAAADLASASAPGFLGNLAASAAAAVVAAGGSEVAAADALVVSEGGLNDGVEEEGLEEGDVCEEGAEVEGGGGREEVVAVGDEDVSEACAKAVESAVIEDEGKDKEAVRGEGVAGEHTGIDGGEDGGGSVGSGGDEREEEPSGGMVDESGGGLEGFGRGDGLVDPGGNRSGSRMTPRGSVRFGSGAGGAGLETDVGSEVKVETAVGEAGLETDVESGVKVETAVGEMRVSGGDKEEMEQAMMLCINEVNSKA